MLVVAVSLLVETAGASDGLSLVAPTSGDDAAGESDCLTRSGAAVDESPGACAGPVASVTLAETRLELGASLAAGLGAGGSVGTVGEASGLWFVVVGRFS